MKTMNENPGKKNPAGKLVGGVIAFIAAIIIIGSTVSTVPAGHTGVILTMGKVSDRMLSEGMAASMELERCEDGSPAQGDQDA